MRRKRIRGVGKSCDEGIFFFETIDERVLDGVGGG